MTSQLTTTCRYCHATLSHHVSMADHYATCTVLATCLEPASPITKQAHLSEAEKAFRADHRRGLVRARVRLKVEKDKG